MSARFMPRSVWPTRDDRPDIVDLSARDAEMARLTYQENLSSLVVAERLGVARSTVTRTLKRMARGKTRARRFRGTTLIAWEPGAPVATCPVCGGVKSRVLMSTADVEGAPIRLRSCDDCGKLRPTAEVNVYGATFASLDDRRRRIRGLGEGRRIPRSVRFGSDHRLRIGGTPDDRRDQDHDRDDHRDPGSAAGS